MLTYEYKLYSSKRNRKLDAMLREACFVWNHALALQRRYYALYGKYCTCAKMKHHFVRRITRTRLHSQTVQEILERLDGSYKRFFDHLATRPPKFQHKAAFSVLVLTSLGRNGQTGPDQAIASRRVLPVHRH